MAGPWFRSGNGPSAPRSRPKGRPPRGCRAPGEGWASEPRTSPSHRNRPRAHLSGTSRTAALLSPGLLAACAGAPPRPAPTLSEEVRWIAAEAWHLDLCLPAGSLAGGPLAPVAGGAPWAAAFAFGFGLEAWMRAARPGSGEALGALSGGPAVVRSARFQAPSPPRRRRACSSACPRAGPPPSRPSSPSRSRPRRRPIRAGAFCLSPLACPIRWASRATPG